MKTRSVPNETVGRLFPYFRALLCFSKGGIKTISSYQLAEACSITSSIIRKDFSYFGDFGTRGVGYDVDDLIKKIPSILKLEPVMKVVLVGVGNIGRALLSYSNFESEGFKIAMAFDNDNKKVGKKINGITIENMEGLEQRVRSDGIKIAILSVSESAAPAVANRLENGGIKAILSFAPCHKDMPHNVKMNYVDLSTEMARLAYYSRKDRV